MAHSCTGLHPTGLGRTLLPTTAARICRRMPSTARVLPARANRSEGGERCRSSRSPTRRSRRRVRRGLAEEGRRGERLP
eukprot:11321872-Alexandrium_andersonii.AAC.1